MTNTTERVSMIAKAIGMELTQEEADKFVKENIFSDSSVETISDEQLDTLIEFLKANNPNEQTSFMPANALEMPSEEFVKDYQDSAEKLAVPVEGTVMVDPVTGVSSICNSTPDFMNQIDTEVTATDIFTGNTKEQIVSKEGYMEAVKDWNLKDDDAMALVEFILRVKNGEIPEGKYYENLPPEIQKSLSAAMPPEAKLQKGAKEFFAEEFVRTVINDANMEEAFIDLNTSLKKEFAAIDDANIINMHTEHIRDIFENKILENANNLEAAGEIDSANKLRATSKAFKDAYTYEPLITKIRNKSGIVNKELTKELKNLDSEVTKLNAKYKHSRFVCKDARGVFPILDRHMPENIPADDIRKFVLLFLHICKKKDVINNPIDHAFIYYFIEFIYRLDAIDQENGPSEFNKNLINKIVEVINLIKTN